MQELSPIFQSQLIENKITDHLYFNSGGAGGLKKCHVRDVTHVFTSIFMDFLKMWFLDL